MEVEQITYVGEVIRQEIRRRKWTNGVAIQALKDAGIEITDTRFSNKIYGERERFTEPEVAILSKALKVKFVFTP